MEVIKNHISDEALCKAFNKYPNNSKADVEYTVRALKELFMDYAIIGADAAINSTLNPSDLSEELSLLRLVINMFQNMLTEQEIIDARENK